MRRERTALSGTKTRRGWFLTGVALALLTGTAFAETPGTYRDSEGSVLLPPVLTFSQAGIVKTTRSNGANSGAGAFGFDLGSGFKTEIEGSTARAPENPFGNLPTSGGLSGSSVMFNGLYEFSDGAWRMKPYVGAGLGVVDANARILGETRNDWVTAYQLHGGVTLGFTQKVAGSLEYRWTMGSKPNFSLAGIPTKLEIDRHGFVLGVNYKY